MSKDSKDSYVYLSEPGVPRGPLLFTFHGTGGNEKQLVSLGRHALSQATIISPRGDVSENGAARFFRRTGEGVYDMEDLAARTVKMAGFVRARADELEPSAIIGLGYSNGANILASVLFAEPGLFNAAVLMHPLIPFEPKVKGSLAGTHILITAGRRDPICPPNLTSRLEAYLQAAGAQVTLEWHDGGHELRTSEMNAVANFLDQFQPRETWKIGDDGQPA